MIPTTLEAFRALMERVANVRVRLRNHDLYAMQLAGQTDAQRHALFAQQLAGPQYTTTLSRADADALRALATATPEQLLGIVGAVDVHRRMMLVSGGHHEPNGTIVLDGPSAVFHRKVDYYIVTPREGA